jgi:HupE / UreJ protein
MSSFWAYFQIGLYHVLSINALDHILFLIALTAVFYFKDWKKVLILVTIFTIGHTLALFLSVFEIIFIKSSTVEYLIPVTILFTAIYNLFVIKNTSKQNITIADIVTLFFGLIHGLGFSNYIKSILSGSPTSKIIPLSEFALGIETAQISVVFTSLTISYIMTTVFKLSKRDWILITSSLIIGLVLPAVIEHKII